MEVEVTCIVEVGAGQIEVIAVLDEAATIEVIVELEATKIITSDGNGTVSIINQNNEEIAVIEAEEGAIYQVEVLTGIIDTIDNNNTTIVDPIN